ncbi:hypothetical protein WJX73_007742 [Symbiochloris irregularis]|uniref:RecA family profile 1 domain-containing protein n=1 Tax=Symbiochloris irregularis TaxID=706552 RepID=A0AAW1NXF1_9CHLO
MSEAELRAFLQPDETALELLSRTVSEPIQTGTWFLGALRIAQVLELTGQSGSAKTEVLIQIAVNCVLPEEAEGRAEHVVLLDLDAKFDALRLIQTLSARIQGAEKDLDRDAELRAALRRFHLVQCRSSFELLAALETLPALIERLQGDGTLQLVLLDNMAAHYWVDKARHATPGQRPTCAAMTLHAVHAAIAGKLQQLLRKYRRGRGW